MGYHSTGYYNTKMYKGNTDQTGHAWWYDESRENPDRPSHYPSFIPMPVMREVLGWNAEESTKLVAYFDIPVLDEVTSLPVRDADGVIVTRTYEVPVTDHKALGRSDWITGGIPDNEEEGANKILSVVSNEYGVHQIKEVFFDNVEELLEGGDGDEQIGIESFGELKWGRRLFASFSVPESKKNPESGLEFRPTLTVVTSYDRTLATKYVRTYGVPICDNTLNWELAKAGDKDGSFTLKHSKNSAGRLADAKKVLGLLSEQADVMNSFLKGLMEIDVPEDIFHKWLNVMVPMPEVKKSIVTVQSIQGEAVQMEKISAHAQTIATKKREKLMDMWETDERVIGKDSRMRNSGAAILQLWNTFNQREASFKGAKAMGGDKDAARAQMNMDKTIAGVWATEDSKALKVLNAIVEENKKELIAVPAGAPTSDPEKKVPARRAPRGKAQTN